VKNLFGIQDKWISTSTRGEQWLILVRFLLLFELLLVRALLCLERPLLFLELLLELGVGSLETQVFRPLVVDALFQSSESLVITRNFLQFFSFLLRVSDHILHKRRDRVKTIQQCIQADKYTGLTMVKSYSSL
jgi:hypothetical protein